jgi:hypothetical protein
LPVKQPEQITKYTDWGFLWFQTMTEIGLMAKGAKQLLEPLGRFDESVQKGLLY